MTQTLENLNSEIVHEPRSLHTGLLEFIVRHTQTESGLLPVSADTLASSHRVAIVREGGFQPVAFLRAKERFALPGANDHGVTAVAETGTLWVSKTHRGHHLGQQLVADMTTALAEDDVTPVTVCSSPGSLDVFLRSGFNVLGRMGRGAAERTVAFYPGSFMPVLPKEQRTAADAQLVAELNAIPRFADLRPMA